MNNEETKKRVTEIYKELETLQEELKDLKKNCSHDSYRIGYFSWRIGCIDTKKLCSHCDEVLGEPSIEEADAFEKEHGFNKI